MPFLQSPPDPCLGFDISKETVTVFDCRRGTTENIANRAAAIRRRVKGLGPGALCVLEPTGGHERRALAALSAAGIPAHRADTLKVKAFSRSFGTLAKSDAIDAKALARYGQERWRDLALWQCQDQSQATLAGLEARRRDLVAAKVAEQNRGKAPGAGAVARSCARLLGAIRREIAAIEAEIETLVENSPALSQRIRISRSVPGVGPRTAVALAATMPELGTMTRRQAASLAGVAPHPNDSGTLRGHRRMRGGRSTIRPILFMAAMAARRANGPLKATYQRLIENGKKPILAIAALMRKIVVILNARIRDEIAKQS